MPDYTYPLILCQVPHQRAPVAWVVETPAQFHTWADDEHYGQWEFPGHFERPGEDDPGAWVDESTEADWIEALRDDMHTFYVVQHSDYPGWDPLHAHQRCAARAAVDRLALAFGWFTADEEAADHE